MGDGGRRFTPPWSTTGWLDAEWDRARDPDLDALLYGGTPERSRGGNAVSRGLAAGTNNPYITIVLAGALIPLGIFIATKEFPLALALSVALFVAAAAVIGLAIVRIPGWHRRRRIAKTYLTGSGVGLPPELRWYS